MKDFDEVLKGIDSSQHLYEMSRIGNVDNFQISVFGDEGKISHFYFFNTTKRERLY